MPAAAPNDKRRFAVATARRVAARLALVLLLGAWPLSYWRQFGVQVFYGFYSVIVTASSGRLQLAGAQFNLPTDTPSPFMVRTEWHAYPNGFMVGNTLLRRLGFDYQLWWHRYVGVVLPFWFIIGLGVTWRCFARRAARAALAKQRGFRVALPGTGADREPPAEPKGGTADPPRALRWYERSRVRRTALGVAALMILGVSLWWTAERVPVLRAQKARLADRLPAGTVVYEDDPERAAALLAGGGKDYGPIPSGGAPLRSQPLAAGRIVRALAAGLPEGPGVLMMLDRRNGEEEQRVVLVRVERVDARPADARTLRCVASVIRPATLAWGSKAELTYSEPFDITAAYGEPVTIFAGEPAIDAYHFRVPMKKGNVAWEITGQVLGDKLVVGVETSYGYPGRGGW